MRLLNLKQSANIANEHFKFSTRNSNGVYYIDGIQSLKLSFSEMLKVGLVTGEDDFVQQILHTESNFLSSDANIYNKRIKFLNDNYFFITQFTAWINEYIPTEESETILNIKLPNVKSFKDLEDSSMILRKSLSQIVPEVGGMVEIKQLDYGSSWVIVAVGTVTAVKLILSLVNAAFNTAQKGLDIAKRYEEYKKMKMENSTLEQLTKYNNLILQDEIEKYALDIESKFFSKNEEKSKIKDNVNERIARIKNSIKNLSDFLKFGGEVHASLNAPDEIRSETPDYEKLEPLELAGLLEQENPPDNNSLKQDNGI